MIVEFLVGVLFGGAVGYAASMNQVIRVRDACDKMLIHERAIQDGAQEVLLKNASAASEAELKRVWASHTDLQDRWMAKSAAAYSQMKYGPANGSEDKEKQEELEKLAKEHNEMLRFGA